MEIKQDHRKTPAEGMGLAVAAMIVLAGGLGVQIALAAQAAGNLDAADREHLLPLAWLALVMLAFDLLVLFWVSVRFVSARSHSRRTQTATRYVDAWAAAGRRFELDNEDPDNDSDGDNQPERDDKPK